MRIIQKFRYLLNKHQKTRILVLAVMMVIGAFLEMMSVSLMLPLVSAIMQPDIIETNKYAKLVCEIFDLHSNRTFMIMVIVGLILVFIFKNIFLVAQYYVQYRFVYNNRFATQQKLLKVYLHRPYEYYLQASTGEIIRVVQQDVSGAFNLLTTFLGLATEAIMSLVLVMTIFIVDPFITVCVGVVLLLLLLFITKVLRPLLRMAGLSHQTNAALTNKWLLQSINGIKELKISQKEPFFESNFELYGRRMISAEKRNAVFGAVPRLMIESVCMCSILGIIALLIYLGRDLEVMIPSLSAFAMAAIKLLPSANRIISSVNSIAYFEPSLDKLLENVKAAEEEQRRQESQMQMRGGASDITLKHQVELSHINYCYPNSESAVLSDASAVFPIGCSVGLVGASGAGKTTAVDLLLGLLKAQSGKVLADGVDIEKNYGAWLAHIGYIPQMIFMMDDSIKSNVAFGFPEEEIDEAEVWRALEEAKLAEYVRELPEGLETQIGERGIRLSGGQRQRIGIARALYTDPDLLIFDEATSALDNETEAAIMESINSLHGKKTMVIIAHRLQTIEGCDMVYRVAGGKIARER